MEEIFAIVKLLKQLQIKPRKQFWGSNGIPTHDLCDTGAMLYQLNYEASPEAGQVRVQFIGPLYEENNVKSIW